jgi:hypothetical protein
VATPHTSDASEPNVVSDRTVFVQTFVGIDEIKDVEAVKTVASVLLFIVVIADEIVLARDVLALSTLMFVVASVAPRDVDAVVTSACVAKEPELRDAPVNVLVELFQTAFAIVEEETMAAPTVKVLSTLTKSIPGVPQVIVVGQVPSGPEEGIV